MRQTYEAVIGIECQVQLATHSKMFCGCPTGYCGAAPNTHVCPICLGMPGVLPVINRVAVEYTLLTGLAMNSEIPEATKFDRKNYPYPDLVKGYQISQYDLPLVKGGWIEITTPGSPEPRRTSAGVGRASGRRRAAGARNGASRQPNARRKKPTTTVTSQSMPCRRSSWNAPGPPSCAPACPSCLMRAAPAIWSRSDSART